MRGCRKQRFPVLFLILFLFFSMTFTAGAATFRVPADYPTIQAGIDAAENGDSVLVDPGTYVERIDFLRKEITVASSAGPEVTIIDADNEGTVVTIEECEQCALSGFSLRNGAGELGVVIRLSDSSPRIAGNIIEEASVGCAAILGDSSSPIIENNTFHHLRCTCYLDCGNWTGVVVFIEDSSPKIRNNLFMDNWCRAIDLDMHKGVHPEIINNTMAGNGAGIYNSVPTYSTRHLYKNNIIFGNSAGFEIQWGTLTNPIFQNNLVFGNGVNYSGVSDLTGVNGNISADPLFLDPGNGDFHLRTGSPAIDAADPNPAGLPAFDLEGTARVIDGNGDGTAVLDLGAYEFDPEAAPRVSLKADQVTGPAPLTVQFTSSVDRAVDEYVWDFGDGTSSTEANPVHTFAPGVYTVSLNAVTSSGVVGSTTRNDLIEAYRAYTITASAGIGGTISPSGATTVKEGDSQIVSIEADPGYRLTEVLVDGTPVDLSTLRRGAGHVYQSVVIIIGRREILTYTFSDVNSDHTITADFTSDNQRYCRYFGMEDGDHMEFKLSYKDGATQTGIVDISEVGADSYLMQQQNTAGSAQSSYYHVDSSGLFMDKQVYSSHQATYFTGLMTVGAYLERKWTEKTSVSIADPDGAEMGTLAATLTAKVSPSVLVHVPSGYFLTYPISYTLKYSGSGKPTSSSWTDYFAPYFGAVKSTYKKSELQTAELSGFAMEGGTVSVPPPVISEVNPESAVRGGAVQIAGYQFGNSRGASAVRIGDVDCDQILSWTDNSIECIVPDSAVSGTVTVVTDTWTSNDSVALTVVIPPVVTGASPALGEKGSVVEVLGHDFGTIKGKVKFGAANAKVKQWGDTSIVCVVPKSLRPRAYPVTVTNSHGKSVLPEGFTVVK